MTYVVVRVGCIECGRGESTDIMAAFETYAQAWKVAQAEPWASDTCTLVLEVPQSLTDPDPLILYRKRRRDNWRAINDAYRASSSAPTWDEDEFEAFAAEWLRVNP